MKHRTWIELRKKALWHNIAQVHALCDSAMLGVVIKANAYGHGMLAIAQLLEEHPAVQWLFVAGTSEGISLRKCGITKPILAMSYLDSDMREMIEHDIACAVYTQSVVRKLNETACALGKVARVHCKIDSNMSRLGVMSNEFDIFFNEIANLPDIFVEGIFTHLCDTNNPDVTFTEEQLRAFDAVISGNSAAQKVSYQHVVASGSLLCKKKYDIIRAGTNIYGFWKSLFQQERFIAHVPHMVLHPVLIWKTRIAWIQNGPGLQKRALLPVGYFDGYPRIEKGYVHVGDYLAPITECVGMNTMIIDVTHIQRVQIGDEVILLGDQSGITATEVADGAGTINNELVTRIHASIPRIVIE